MSRAERLWNIAMHAIQCSHDCHLGSEQRRCKQTYAIERLHTAIVAIAIRNLPGWVSDRLL